MEFQRLATLFLENRSLRAPLAVSDRDLGLPGEIPLPGTPSLPYSPWYRASCRDQHSGFPLTQVPLRLGIPLRGFHVPGFLVPLRADSPHQCAGTPGHCPYAPTDLTPCRISDSCCLRQLHCGCVRQQAGGATVEPRVVGMPEPIPPTPGQRLVHPSPAHPRPPERDRRSAVQVRPDPAHGVVTPSPAVPLDHGPVSYTHLTLPTKA